MGFKCNDQDFTCGLDGFVKTVSRSNKEINKASWLSSIEDKRQPQLRISATISYRLKRIRRKYHSQKRINEPGAQKEQGRAKISNKE